MAMAVLRGGLSRRGFIAAGAASTLALGGRAFGQEPGLVIEEQRGDINLKAEKIGFDPYSVGSMSSTKVRAALSPKVETFGDKLVSVAKEFVDFNRKDNEAEITRFLQLFSLGFTYGADKTPTPFCAAGAAYVAALAYYRDGGGTSATPTLSELRAKLIEVGEYHFYPTPSVMDMYYVARGTRRWRERTKAPSPGWLVVYSWEQKEEKADHVGIVKSYDAAAKKITTIEFNTSKDTGGSQSDGGYVATRTRNVNGTVKGYIDVSAKNPFA